MHTKMSDRIQPAEHPKIQYQIQDFLTRYKRLINQSLFEFRQGKRLRLEAPYRKAASVSIHPQSQDRAEVAT